MRTRYTLINMVVNVGGQLMNQVLLFISRMVFIHYLSAAYLGVNGLFTDVLGILNLAELGIGTAMIYSLYEPAAKNDEHRLAQLMNLYRLLYRIVAVVVLLVGLALMPFWAFHQGQQRHRASAAHLSDVCGKLGLLLSAEL